MGDIKAERGGRVKRDCAGEGMKKRDSTMPKPPLPLAPPTACVRHHQGRMVFRVGKKAGWRHISLILLRCSRIRKCGRHEEQWSPARMVT